MLWLWKSSRLLGLCSKAMRLKCLSACVTPEPLFQQLMANLTVGRFNAYWREPPPLWCNGLVIHRMRTVLPRAKITAWCNEDTPFVWPKILRHLIGLDAEEPINAGYDLIGSLLTEIGTRKMQNYFITNPPNSEKERQRVLAAFWEHYANPDEVEEEITLPGWTNDLLTRLSDLYDQDVNAIISRGDVKVIEPAL